ncbi:hypothetical protein FFWV33_08470 [Flavobacterium faecale]|uniref:TonB C-terminal domain-containing protein n=1 Tax=Flavobacterium faecale TaxID=1355330 RepID=A0A2S1LCX4_9FLAO|nr:energy transducer TonB [Flavobacterium faecale]AWG21561.1 hypothetical protein FFWV33_08470 [Flavobacterium faecale]
MSKSSIYESNWINLVFENRNKEYGAFQLRQESAKTSFMALLISISICALVFAVPKVLQSFDLLLNDPVEIAPPTIDRPIIPVRFTPPPTEVQPEAKAIVPKVKPQVVTEKIVAKSLAHPIVVQADLATADVPKTDLIPTSSIDPNAIIGDKPTIYKGATTPEATGTTTSPGYGDKIATTAALDKLPAFPGGIEKFYNYVGRTFETPEINEEKMVRIMVYFVVEKDGSMTDIQVKNNPGYGLDKEAIRVLKSLKTKWTPGIINKEPVRTAYSMPISVQMY